MCIDSHKHFKHCEYCFLQLRLSLLYMQFTWSIFLHCFYGTIYDFCCTNPHKLISSPFSTVNYNISCTKLILSCEIQLKNLIILSLSTVVNCFTMLRASILPPKHEIMYFEEDYTTVLQCIMCYTLLTV